MNDEVKKQLEEICSKQHVELPDHLALTWEYNSAWMAGARAAWELATKPTPERGDITPKVTEDDERDAKEEFSAPHDGYAHGGLSASQTGYRSECARCRWLFDDVVPPRGDPTPLGVCGFKLTRIRKLFYDAGRLGLREAVEAAVERERERILKLVDGPYGCNPYDLKIEILNPPPRRRAARENCSI